MYLEAASTAQHDLKSTVEKFQTAGRLRSDYEEDVILRGRPVIF